MVLCQWLGHLPAVDCTPLVGNTTACTVWFPSKVHVINNQSEDGVSALPALQQLVFNTHKTSTSLVAVCLGLLKKSVCMRLTIKFRFY